MAIDMSNAVNAEYASTWNISFFSSPKIEICCGRCAYVWKTRDWTFLRNRGNQIIATCPACVTINRTGFVYG